jgi:hypothetical protein
MVHYIASFPLKYMFATPGTYPGLNIDYVTRWRNFFTLHDILFSCLISYYLSRHIGSLEYDGLITHWKCVKSGDYPMSLWHPYIYFDYYTNIKTP